MGEMGSCEKLGDSLESDVKMMVVVDMGVEKRNWATSYVFSRFSFSVS